MGALKIAGSIFLAAVVALLFSSACGSTPCEPDCGDGNICDRGTCRISGKPSTRYCGPAQITNDQCAVFEAGADGGVIGCALGPGNTAICCPPGSYTCGDGCYPSAANAYDHCQAKCVACQGSSDVFPSTCGAGQARCAQSSACCPCDRPFFACNGLCFPTHDDAAFNCDISGPNAFPHEDCVCSN